jgi:hypothetical protein
MKAHVFITLEFAREVRQGGQMGTAVWIDEGDIAE